MNDRKSELKIEHLKFKFLLSWDINPSGFFMFSIFKIEILP